MGTRADFYKETNDKMEWLGSIAWDGYPSGISDTVLNAKTEQEYLDALALFLKERDDVTLPESGWPWPWDDSNTTDYAYLFDGKTVKASSFGSVWVDPKIEQDDFDELEGDSPNFPNMKAIANTQLSGSKSGLIVISG